MALMFKLIISLKKVVQYNLIQINSTLINYMFVIDETKTPLERGWRKLWGSSAWFVEGSGCYIADSILYLSSRHVKFWNFQNFILFDLLKLATRL
jgi:hypothetical protein